MSEKLKELNGKKIAMLGLGLENYALIKYLLAKKVDCVITICDARSETALGKMYHQLKNKQNIAWRLDGNSNKKLDGFDIVFRSPGWPLFDPEIQQAKKMGVKITSPMDLFFQLCPTENLIGVTGTKGKGTTASLIYDILLADKKRVWLGGNIGVAPFSFINKIKKSDWIVLELSSFQLEDITVSPHIAVMTNFYSEHLAPADPNNPNYHKNLHTYWQAKINLLRWQKNYDRAIINKTLKKAVRTETAKNHTGHAVKIYFSKSFLPTKLIGPHNKENIAAAVAAARLSGVTDNIIRQAIKNFHGLEHRLEFVGRKQGVDFYDDSFATTPESTIIALKAFSAPVILFAGGAEKNSGFADLAKAIKKRVKFLILFAGDATPRLKRQVLKTGYNQNQIKIVSSMTEAVKLATHIATKNDTVLLSPACASFGLFKNYKQRGDQFKKAVIKL